MFIERFFINIFSDNYSRMVFYNAKVCLRKTGATFLKKKWIKLTKQKEIMSKNILIEENKMLIGLSLDRLAKSSYSDFRWLRDKCVTILKNKGGVTKFKKVCRTKIVQKFRKNLIMAHSLCSEINRFFPDHVAVRIVPYDFTNSK